MTVSETVADQCMNWSNSLEALNRDLKLVLARLAPGNPEICEYIGVPRSLNWSYPIVTMDSWKSERSHRKSDIGAFNTGTVIEVGTGLSLFGTGDS